MHTPEPMHTSRSTTTLHTGSSGTAAPGCARRASVLHSRMPHDNGREEPVVNEYRLISSDSHVTIPVDAWQEYLPEHLREKAPRIVRTDDGDFTEFEGKRTPIQTLNNLAGKKPEDYSLNVRRLEDQRPGAWDPAARIRDMDLDGVDAEVLYLGGPLRTADTELRLASIHGYNRWLADYCAPAPKRLLGMGAVELDTPELAAEL